MVISSCPSPAKNECSQHLDSTNTCTNCSSINPLNGLSSPLESESEPGSSLCFAFLSSPTLKGPCIFTTYEDASAHFHVNHQEQQPASSSTAVPASASLSADAEAEAVDIAEAPPTTAIYKRCKSFDEAVNFILTRRNSSVVTYKSNSSCDIAPTAISKSCSGGAGSRKRRITEIRSNKNVATVDSTSLNNNASNDSNNINNKNHISQKNDENEGRDEGGDDDDEGICDIRGIESCGTYLNLGKWEGDWSIAEARAFDEAIDEKYNVESLFSTVGHYKSLLRRTRAVTVLTNRLRLAKTEDQCYEVVTRLIVTLFNIDRCSFALLKDRKRFFIKQCSCKKVEYAPELQFSIEGSNFVAPLAGTAVAQAVESREILYIQDLKKSPFRNARAAKAGMRSAIVCPIMIPRAEGEEDHLAGTLNITAKEIDTFSGFDILLVKDIAQSFGVHIYLKRLRKAQEQSHQTSRLLLTSMIPKTILPKIEQHWKNLVEAGNESFSCNSSELSDVNDKDQISEINNNNVNDNNNNDEDNVIPQIPSIISKASRVQSHSRLSIGNLSKKLDNTRKESINMDNSEKSKVLYAEEQKGVSMIFTDMVGFSRIAQALSPLQVMDMLQSLFDRFDKLCDLYGVKKLETIGDAYICCAGLLEEGEKNEKSDALSCLSMAQAMVKATEDLFAPTNPPERIQIRVGIHVGDIYAGVLGQAIPKFSVYGNAVNIAARMEQTSEPSKIHLSKEFHDLIAIGDENYEKKSLTTIKNMGEIETWVLKSEMIDR